MIRFLDGSQRADWTESFLEQMKFLIKLNYCFQMTYIYLFLLDSRLITWCIRRGDTTILIKKFLTWIVLENVPTCSQGSTVYQKNKNNFVKGFVMGKNRQKCQKFSLLDRFLKLTELVDQYLMHVNFSKFSNFHQFFRFLNWLPLSPNFLTGDIIRYI